MGGCLFAVAMMAGAQSARKPGLWEATSTMSFGGQQMPQAPQLPPGMQMPPGAMGGPHTTQVCVTQAMVDKYGGPYSSPQRGDCQVTSHTLTATGATATISCTGNFTGTGTVETTFTGPDSTETKMHMTGTAQGGKGSHPVDMTMQINSVYKGPDCGNVKPLPMPTEK
jgi:hypothetical protein